MRPSRALWNAIMDAAAADAAFLAAIAAMKVHLAAAALVPGLDLVLGTLTEATFTGSAAKDAGTGTQNVYYDVGTGMRVIELLEPAGGWTWECTVTPSTAETIHGIYVTNNANAVLLGSELLPAPVTISEAGQGISVARIRLSFSTSYPT